MCADLLDSINEGLVSALAVECHEFIPVGARSQRKNIMGLRVEILQMTVFHVNQKRVSQQQAVIGGHVDLRRNFVFAAIISHPLFLRVSTKLISLSQGGA